MIIKYINSSLVFVIILIIKFYQLLVSPILKTNCRYIPTCSEYSILSIKEHGILKGIYMSVLRILSCHPFGKGGYDPIKKKTKKEF
tara:strand:- start:1416 stop:1673 length:258 start_codon:yes stop_codon:yes gene_type:complete